MLGVKAAKVGIDRHSPPGMLNEPGVPERSPGMESARLIIGTTQVGYPWKETCSRTRQIRYFC